MNFLLSLFSSCMEFMYLPDCYRALGSRSHAAFPRF